MNEQIHRHHEPPKRNGVVAKTVLGLSGLTLVGLISWIGSLYTFRANAESAINRDIPALQMKDREHDAQIRCLERQASEISAKLGFIISGQERLEAKLDKHVEK